jgi:hypothetical protein
MPIIAPSRIRVLRLINETFGFIIIDTNKSELDHVIIIIIVRIRYRK